MNTTNINAEDLVGRLTTPVEPTEPEIEQPINSFSTPKKPHQLENSGKPESFQICKPNPLDKIKRVADAIGSYESPEVDFIAESFNLRRNGSTFAVAQDTKELAKSYYGRIEYKEPGSLSSSTFEIQQVEPTGKSFTASDIVTVQDVKDAAKGTIAERVNFDMLNELKEQIYHTQFELDKYRDVKDSNIESLEQSLNKAKEVIEHERAKIVTSNLLEVLDELNSVKAEEKSPEQRTALWDAIHNIRCALALVNKAGFGLDNTSNEQIVIDYVVKAIGLWPDLKKNSRIEALTSQIFGLSVI